MAKASNWLRGFNGSMFPVSVGATPAHDVTVALKQGRDAPACNLWLSEHAEDQQGDTYEKRHLLVELTPDDARLLRDQLNRYLFKLESGHTKRKE